MTTVECEATAHIASEIASRVSFMLSRVSRRRASCGGPSRAPKTVCYAAS